MKTEVVKTIVIIVLASLTLLLTLDEFCYIKLIDISCGECDYKSQYETMNDTSLQLLSDIHCTDPDRYNVSPKSNGGGKAIDSASAGDYIKQFWIDFAHGGNPNDFNKGVFISKQAIDRMFDDSARANGLTCLFAKDEYGNLNIVFTPTRASQIYTSYPKTSRPIVIAETWCPNVCGVFSRLAGQLQEPPPPPATTDASGNTGAH